MLPRKISRFVRLPETLGKADWWAYIWETDKGRFRPQLAKAIRKGELKEISYYGEIRYDVIFRCVEDCSVFGISQF